MIWRLSGMHSYSGVVSVDIVWIAIHLFGSACVDAASLDPREALKRGSVKGLKGRVLGEGVSSADSNRFFS